MEAAMRKAASRAPPIRIQRIRKIRQKDGFRSYPKRAARSGRLAASPAPLLISPVIRNRSGCMRKSAKTFPGAASCPS